MNENKTQIQDTASLTDALRKQKLAAMNRHARRAFLAQEVAARKKRQRLAKLQADGGEDGVRG